jgi:hypothetical protein
MKYVRTVKGCTRTDRVRNVDEFDIVPLYKKKISDYKDKWKKCICKGWNRLSQPRQPRNIIRLVEEL